FVQVCIRSICIYRAHSIAWFKISPAKISKFRQGHYFLFRLSAFALAFFLKNPLNKKLCCTASRSSFSLTELACKLVNVVCTCAALFGSFSKMPMALSVVLSLLLALLRLSLNADALAAACCSCAAAAFILLKVTVSVNNLSASAPLVLILLLN